MSGRIRFGLLLGTFLLGASAVSAQPIPPNLELPETCSFTSTGTNPYFVLQPGWTLDFEGTEGGEFVELSVTVLNDTKVVDGVQTRVVFEEEKADHKLVERSWNWFAMCQETGSVFYFGEDVDIYENGQVVSHEGAWQAGVDNARPGVIMPGKPEVGMFYFQEIAPLVAMDCALVLAVDEQRTVPAGSFSGVLHTPETTPVEPGSFGEKWYAPGVGIIEDGAFKLIRYGF